METRLSHRRWQCGPPVLWLSLPPEVMRRIFSYLADSDRCCARLVCRQWAEVFRMPQLWRARCFSFRGQDEHEARRAMRYIDDLGIYLRHLDVEIGMPVVQNARNISRAVETFLNACQTRKVHLQSLTLSGLEYFQTPLYRIYRHRYRMVRALCTLLRRQKWLKNVDLGCSQMGREDGGRVLKALTSQWRTISQTSASVTNSTVCLEQLELRDFFLDDVQTAAFPTFLEEVSKFSALRHIALNFTYMSDEVLERLTAEPAPGVKRRLETLSLSLDGSHLLLIAHFMHTNQAVTTAGWRAAVHRCPNIRVFVEMRGRFRLVDFQRVLIPGMPLASLHITSLIASLFFGSDDMMAHIASLLTHLGQHFCYTLKTFQLDWSEPTALWTHCEALVQLVTKCRLLRSIALTMNVPLDTLLQVVTAASRHPSSEPLNVSMRVVGIDRNLSREEVQSKLAARASSDCVVHARILH